MLWTTTMVAALAATATGASIQGSTTDDHSSSQQSGQAHLVENDAAYCVLEQEGHPSIDLNALGLEDQDYSIGSHSFNGYDYVINVCRGLNYNDDTCHGGSSVCERHRSSDRTTEVFGYTSSTKLRWADAPEGVYGVGSHVVMEMTGGQCWSDPTNTTDAKVEIKFVCSAKEFLALDINEGRTHDPQKCTVGFTFYSSQACGAERYECFNGTKCVTSADNTGKYGRFEGCRADCGEVPQYACVHSAAEGHQCIESLEGNHADFASCQTSCAAKAVRVSAAWNTRH